MATQPDDPGAPPRSAGTGLVSGADQSRPTVLHVTTCFAGGVSRAVCATASATPDHTHHLLAAGADLDRAVAADAFVSISELPGGFVRQLRRVRAELLRVQPTIVHAHSSWAGVLVRLAAPRGASIVYQPHGYVCERRGSLVGLVGFVVEAALAQRRQCVAVLSAREDRLARLMNPRGATVLVPNVPSVGSTGIRTDRAVARPPRIAMIGRACHQKDPRLFLRVVRRLRQQVPDLEAVWIGEGEARHERELERGGIQVTGWLSDPELVSEIADVDAIVHTARYEGFPISVLDAAARGVPVVARRIPAFEGTTLRQAHGARGLAEQVVRCLDDKAVARDTAVGASLLLRLMNHEVQSTSFRHLYRDAAVLGRRAIGR